MGGVIPLRRETPVMRAMRRIRSVMAKGLAPVIAFSSGKDSSSLANLVLNTAREMKEQGEQPMPILVVHSNTGVEQPEIAQLAKDELAKMKVFAKKHGLEVEVRIGQPTLSASFPVRVIGGRGLPSFPDSRADCSTDWKVSVNTRLIDQAYKDLSQRAEVNGVVVMTGVRQDESIARDQRIKKRGEVAEGVWERDDLVLSTKIFFGYKKGPNNTGLSRKHIVEGTKASLKRMGLDYVDLLFCHRPDPLTPMEETVRAMNFCIDQGWAFYWGTSEWSSQEVLEACAIADRLGLQRPVMDQPQCT